MRARISKEEVNLVAFGDKGPRKKTWFERLTLLVVLLMVLITIGGVLLTAYSAFR